MAVEDVACAETRDALDALAAARLMRIAGEVREVEVLAQVGADPDPYRDDHGRFGKEWIVEDVSCERAAAAVLGAEDQRASSGQRSTSAAVRAITMDPSGCLEH